jgi:hypothetical protein
MRYKKESKRKGMGKNISHQQRMRPLTPGPENVAHLVQKKKKLSEILNKNHLDQVTQGYMLKDFVYSDVFILLISFIRKYVSFNGTRVLFRQREAPLGHQ